MIRRRLSAAGAILSCIILLTACSGQPTGNSVTASNDAAATAAANGNNDAAQTDNSILTQDTGIAKTDPATESLFQTDETGGLKATLVVEKSEYSEGETVNYTITVENNKKHCYTAKTELNYTNSPIFKEAYEGSLPTQLPKLAYGESTVLSGAVVGDKTNLQQTALAAPKNESGDFETVTLRPYVKFIYGGEEVMIRASVELHVYQERVMIPKDHKKIIKSFTCHDPSIFKDSDGTYYSLGTHITGGTSKDLINWTSIDNEVRAAFSQETIRQIREWNKDEKSGSWFGYLWAPDIIYNPVLEKYCYYLSANGDDWKSNIVMLTADSPTGPFTYAGSVVYGGFTQEDMAETDLPAVLGTDELPVRYITNGIKNKKWGDKWPNCIDPCVFYDAEGNLWMSYGSWSGGIFLLALDEHTGLRDYSVSYETNDHSDAYFGRKIAGGWYVSGEGSYIQKIGDWYWLFMSYGNLEARGGYNIRVFRSATPDGDYVDELGNSALYDKYIFNYNQSVGVRLFGAYKWRTFAQGQVAQGHNSAFVDDDGRAFIVYHSRTTDGSEGHTVKIHQLFLNKEGWLVAAPYYFADEKLEDSVSMTDYAGEYEVILHKLDIDYKNLETAKPSFITLCEDGRITGDHEGSWELESGSPYIMLKLGSETYSGVVLKQCVENSDLETDVFTALGKNTQITVWGSKTLDLE
ncbi:MAG: glycoside hydrolase family 43 protein [Lachnospiraceae bacterium]|nr:glycoside hydrolase family 43 protein [Lachnospiraceae bacterium]